jgi:hypothetical protein
MRSYEEATDDKKDIDTHVATGETNRPQMVDYY